MPAPGRPPGTGEGGRRRTLRDEEPFATIRAHPRRFGWGIPIAFLAPFGLALLLVPTGLGVAIAVQLVLQTAILLWLYVPVARGRTAREDDGPGGSGAVAGPDTRPRHGRDPRSPHGPDEGRGHG